MISPLAALFVPYSSYIDGFPYYSTSFIECEQILGIFKAFFVHNLTFLPHFYLKIYPELTWAFQILHFPPFIYTPAR